MQISINLSGGEFGWILNISARLGCPLNAINLYRLINLRGRKIIRGCMECSRDRKSVARQPATRTKEYHILPKLDRVSMVNRTVFGSTPSAKAIISSS